MQQVVMIAVGGALGAVMRFGVYNGVHALLGRGFPYGTLTVNVLGSFIMGLMYILMIERLSWGPEWRVLITVGFLGAFTTFSTFSIETFNLLEQGELVKAMLNVLLSVFLCITATWFGVVIGRQ